MSQAVVDVWCVARFVISSASKYIKMFVLDEADEMLSRGFKDQIYEIFQKLAPSTQVTASPLSASMQCQKRFDFISNAV